MRSVDTLSLCGILLGVHQLLPQFETAICYQNSFHLLVFTPNVDRRVILGIVWLSIIIITVR